MGHDTLLPDGARTIAMVTTRHSIDTTDSSNKAISVRLLTNDSHQVTSYLSFSRCERRPSVIFSTTMELRRVHRYGSLFLERVVPGRISIFFHSYSRSS